MANIWLWGGSSSSHPTIYYDVYVNTGARNGRNVSLQFQVNAWLSSGGKLLTGHTLDLYGGTYSGSSQAHVNIRGYNDRWTDSSVHTSYSDWFTVDNLNSSITLYFFIEGSGFSASPNLYGLSGTAAIPAYNPPSAPTWANITPNPCNINSRPTISWGGATAGSSGQLLYDIEVRSTKGDGNWTNWLRIVNSQTKTSYNEIVLANMNVLGQKPFVGVKYQYRIRVYDGVGGEGKGTSAWINTPELKVDFTLPTAPTVQWSASTVKRNKNVTVSWSGANGGSGTITNYTLVVSLVGANQSTVVSTKTYTQTSTSKTINVLSEFPSAKNGNYLKANVYTNNSWGQRSSASSSVYTLVKGNQMWVKINGTWKEGECYIKINGAWREGLPYIKVNGAWKESI